MKAVFAILFLASVGLANAQSYVDSGIQHYLSEEFEDALEDFDEAIKLKSLFTAFSVSKLHFYKGMSLYKLHGDDPKLAGEMIQQINVDLKTAIKLDSSWYPSIVEVNNDLYDKVLNLASIKLKESRKQKEFEPRINQINNYIELLNVGFDIRKTAEIELLIAQGYHEIGDLYFENSHDVTSLQKAGNNYQKAIEYYELARYDDPFSKDIIKALLLLSQRMDDPGRVDEYNKLLVLAGG